MKSKSAIALFVLAATLLPAGAQTVTWTNFLRQRQMLSGVELQVDVASSGSRLSLLPLELSGAQFQIWTLKSGTGQVPQLLATQFVDAYQTGATVQIQTGDPYALIPRTRVDQPFTVRVHVTGLRPIVPGGDLTGTSVRFNHTASRYTAGSHLPSGSMSTSTVFNGTITQNGQHTFNFTGANLAGSGVSAASGEENFTVSSLTALGAIDTTLATGRMQVWPLSTVSIAGISNGTTYSTMPEVTFTYNDLYPDSQTWVQIYRGAPALGTNGTTVTSSIITIEDVTPQDRNFILRNWDNFFQEDGQYTMEVLHTTPFGTERLAHVTFSTDRTIEINGQIFSSE